MGTQCSRDRVMVCIGGMQTVARKIAGARVDGRWFFFLCLVEDRKRLAHGYARVSVVKTQAANRVLWVESSVEGQAEVYLRV